MERLIILANYKTNWECPANWNWRKVWWVQLMVSFDLSQFSRWRWTLFFHPITLRILLEMYWYTCSMEKLFVGHFWSTDLDQCKCFGCRVKLFLSFPNIGKLVIWLRRISRHSPDDLPTIKVWNWGQRNFNSMEEIWKYNNRDHKHRQRNGTTTTGESKIFPRERSVHVKTSFRLRWRLNLSRFSSWWKRR